MNRLLKWGGLIVLVMVFMGVEARAQSNDIQWGKLVDSLSKYTLLEQNAKAIDFAKELIEATRGKADSLNGHAMLGLAYLYFKEEMHKKALEKFDEALVVAKAYPILTAQLLYNKAEVTLDLAEYDQTKQLLEQSLALYREHNREKNGYLNALTLLAKLHQTKGEYTLAENYYRDALAKRKTLDGANSAAYCKALHSIGYLYLDMGKNEEAKTIFIQVEKVYKQKLGTSNSEYTAVLSHIGYVLLMQQKYNEAASKFEKTVELDKKSKRTKTLSHASHLNNLASAYLQLGALEKAEKAFLASIQAKEDVLGKAHSKVASAYYNLSILYHRLGKQEKALQMMEGAIEVWKNALNKTHPYYTRGLANLGKLYALYNKPKDQVYSTLYQSIIWNSKMAIDTANVEASALEVARKGLFRSDDIAIYSLFYLLETHTHYYKETKDTFYLQKRLATALVIASHIERTQKVLTNQTDKNNVLGHLTQAVYDGISAAQDFYEQTKNKENLNVTLELADYNKSAVLSSTLQSTEALNFGEVPSHLVEKEKELQQKLDDLEKEKIKATNTKDTAALTEVNSSIIDLNLEQDALLKELKENYPKYSKLRYEQQELDVSEVQKELLDEKTALLEYFIYDTIVYLIVLKQNDIDLHQMTFQKKELNKQVEDFRKSLSDYTFITGYPDKAYALYAEKASYFYEQLIAPANLAGIEKLIIVPDNLLAHIPFEALLLTPANSQDGNYKDLDYLIKHYTISYSYSTELLLENKKQAQRQNNGQLLAIGAMYSAADSNIAKSRSPLQKQLRKILVPLPSIKKEIERLSKQYDGHFLYGKEATEAQFKALASDYAIVHLAMHGLLNEHYPLISSLAFTENGDTLEDNFLEAHEISHLQLNNDLVVLSACETGYGKFEQGEGVMSLARSFMYAGVPSLVVSLWQVNDNATSLLMHKFYVELHNRLPKDEALQQAKLNYISNVKGIGAHPAFWSPFIQLGNTDVIQLGKNKTWLWWIGVSLGALLLFILGWKLARKKEVV